MTFLIVFGLFSFISFLSCSNSTEGEISQRELIAINNELSNELKLRDLALVELFQTLNEVKVIIDSIEVSQNIIVQKKSVFESSEEVTFQEDILEDLNNLGYELQKASGVIRELEDYSNILVNQKEQIDSLVSNYQREIVEKEFQIRTLILELSNLKLEVAKKDSVISEQNELIEEKELEVVTQSEIIEEIKSDNSELIKQLNTIHYLIDDESDLLDKKILVKRGGFLRIGRTIQMSDNIDLELLNTKNINSLERSSFFIANNFSQVRIYPERNNGLYQINGSYINIIGEEFWLVSRVLIISVK